MGNNVVVTVDRWSLCKGDLFVTFTMRDFDV